LITDTFISPVKAAVGIPTPAGKPMGNSYRNPIPRESENRIFSFNARFSYFHRTSSVSTEQYVRIKWW